MIDFVWNMEECYISSEFKDLHIHQTQSTSEAGKSRTCFDVSKVTQSKMISNVLFLIQISKSFWSSDHFACWEDDVGLFKALF